MANNLRTFFVICIFAAVFGLVAIAQGATFKAYKINSSELQSTLNQSLKANVIIVLKEQADIKPSYLLKSRLERARFVYKSLTEAALASQGKIVSLLETHKIPYRRFHIINMISAQNAPKNLVEQISQREDVKRVFLDKKMYLLENPRDLSFDIDLPSSIETNITYTKAPIVWENGVRGEGIVVAGQDTGVQWNHPALKNQYRGFDGENVDHNYNWHDAIHKSDPGDSNKCGYDLKVPCDDNNHGTHTIGTIVGADGDRNQIGMAPKAQWIACRNMDAGYGTPSTYIECFEFFLAPYPYGGNSLTDGKPELAPHVMNNSWGCPSQEGCSGDEFLPVLEALKAAGIMVVASAGNDGPACSTIHTAPAHHSALTLSVGAYDHRRNKIASFSSRGPSAFDLLVGPDIVAPGVSIRSSVPGNNYQGSYWSGTSMAGPHVVGQIALMWSANPELIGEIETTTNMVQSTATPKEAVQSCSGVPGTEIPNNTMGFGMINALKAVEAAKGH